MTNLTKQHAIEALDRAGEFKIIFGDEYIYYKNTGDFKYVNQFLNELTETVNIDTNLGDINF